MTQDKTVPHYYGMLSSDLAFVRARLEPLGPAERKAVSASVGCNVKTLNRIASQETKHGRTDTIGKIAMYFRANKRRKAA